VSTKLANFISLQILGEEGNKIGIKEWILIFAIVLYLLVAIPMLIDNHKSIKRIEERCNRKKR
jgi:hypothetical protein